MSRLYRSKAAIMALAGAFLMLTLNLFDASSKTQRHARASDPGYCTGLCYPAQYQAPIPSPSACTGATYIPLLDVTKCTKECEINLPYGLWTDGFCFPNEEPTGWECTMQPPATRLRWFYYKECLIATGQQSFCPCNIFQADSEDVEVRDCARTNCPY